MIEQMMNLGQSPSTVPLQPVEREKIFQWILELSYLDTRENALLELRLYASALLLYLGILFYKSVNMPSSQVHSITVLHVVCYFTINMLQTPLLVR